MSARHFLTLLDLHRDDLLNIVRRAIELKRQPQQSSPLAQKTLGLIFEKSSTRTRVAFEVAMTQLGGSSFFLAPADSQLGRGETVEDSARVLSRMVDCIAIRTFEHGKLERFASYSHQQKPGPLKFPHPQSLQSTDLRLQLEATASRRLEEVGLASGGLCLGPAPRIPA